MMAKTTSETSSRVSNACANLRAMYAPTVRSDSTSRRSTGEAVSTSEPAVCPMDGESTEDEGTEQWVFVAVERPCLWIFVSVSPVLPGDARNLQGDLEVQPGFSVAQIDLAELRDPLQASAQGVEMDAEAPGGGAERTAFGEVGVEGVDEAGP